MAKPSEFRSACGFHNAAHVNGDAPSLLVPFGQCQKELAGSRQRERAALNQGKRRGRFLVTGRRVDAWPQEPF